MATATLVKPLTTKDLLAMPDDGMERWLIDGELREKPMTKRNRVHSRIMVRLSHLLSNWLDDQPLPRGEILCGEAGVILRRDPETMAGIDIVYISAELVAEQNDETMLVAGVPVLVVEILSPSETHEEVDEKIDKYLEASVPLAWIVDPHNQTVLVHRPDALPQLFNVEQELIAEPHLPGFRLAVARIFN
jgi:Uma2 family endonuclease